MIVFYKRVFVILLWMISSQVVAQQTAPVNEITTELELGAIFTSGNTEDENILYSADVDWLRGDWEYEFQSAGFRSSKDDELAAQILAHEASAQYNINETNYWKGRVAYEDDRFSGFDYQADATISYGHTFLQNLSNMTLSTEAGVGYRQSETADDKFTEGIIRLVAEYQWDLSENANFFQNLSAEIGEEATIYRSETGIESSIMENLSLQFAVNVKHTTEVPPEREKTDTRTAISLIWTF